MINTGVAAMALTDCNRSVHQAKRLAKKKTNINDLKLTNKLDDSLGGWSIQLISVSNTIQI